MMMANTTRWCFPVSAMVLAGVTCASIISSRLCRHIGDCGSTNPRNNGRLSWRPLPFQTKRAMSPSLIGRLGSSVFRLSTTTVSMSLTGSRFSSESAPRPFQYGIRERGGTIYWATLPSDERRVQGDIRTHLIHRPARDIIPPLGGAQVFSYRN
jgi:hypothetical protein